MGHRKSASVPAGDQPRDLGGRFAHKPLGAPGEQAALRSEPLDVRAPENSLVDAVARARAAIASFDPERASARECTAVTEAARALVEAIESHPAASEHPDISPRLRWAHADLQVLAAASGDSQGTARAAFRGFQSRKARLAERAAQVQHSTLADHMGVMVEALDGQTV